MVKPGILYLDDDLPDELNLNNVEGRIYLSTKYLNNWINDVKSEYDFSKSKISKIWSIFDKHKFVVIDTYNFSYYTERHQDFRKIKKYLKNKKYI